MNWNFGNSIWYGSTRGRQAVRIILDGMEHEVPEGMTVLRLLEEEGEPVTHVLVELNGRHLRQHAYATTRLNENDRVEVILPAAGG
jgi:thiamine biosynthesis protein ThiS